MKRFFLIFTMILFFLTSLFVFSAETQENRDQTILNQYGELSEIGLASETFAFFPKNYSVVYIKPAGEGLIGEISIFTYRPKMLLYRGVLTENGLKFTTLFPTIHFVYVTNSYTGSKYMITYKPAAGSENMSQNDRIKLAFEHAEAVDKEYFAKIKELEDRNRARNQERERAYRERTQHQSQTTPQ